MTINEAYEKLKLITVSYKLIVFGIDRWKSDGKIRGYDNIMNMKLNIDCLAKAEYTIKSLFDYSTLAIRSHLEIDDFNFRINWLIDTWYNLSINDEKVTQHINPLKNHYKADVSEYFEKESEARVFPNTLDIGFLYGMHRSEIRDIPNNWLNFISKECEKLEEWQFRLNEKQIATKLIVNNLLKEKHQGVNKNE